MYSLRSSINIQLIHTTEENQPYLLPWTDAIFQEVYMNTKLCVSLPAHWARGPVCKWCFYISRTILLSIFFILGQAVFISFGVNVGNLKAWSSVLCDAVIYSQVLKKMFWFYDTRWQDWKQFVLGFILILLLLTQLLPMKWFALGAIGIFMNFPLSSSFPHILQAPCICFWTWL